MNIKPRWHGPLIDREGRVLKPLSDYLDSIGSTSDTAATDVAELESRVTSLESSDEITIIGMNGVSVMHPSDSVWQISGNEDQGILAAQIFGG
jgi:hypothetical protein